MNDPTFSLPGDMQDLARPTSALRNDVYAMLMEQGPRSIAEIAEQLGVSVGQLTRLVDQGGFANKVEGRRQTLRCEICKGSVTAGDNFCLHCRERLTDRFITVLEVRAIAEERAQAEQENPESADTGTTVRVSTADYGERTLRTFYMPSAEERDHGRGMFTRHHDDDDKPRPSRMANASLDVDDD